MTATLTTLVSFNGANGESPEGALIVDSNGDLFGTTASGGANNYGTVFEIAKTAGGYAGTPTTLVSFNADDGAFPEGSLIVDSNGDLFGTTDEGAGNYGTVFEIAKTATGYAGAPTTLVSFNFVNGSIPMGGLIADSNGNLFGTTFGGGANGDGTVFEIVKTPTGYAATPTTLVSFNDTNGPLPDGSLIADSNGDLFGTTQSRGSPNDGTVFEIAKTATGYAGAPTTLVSFNFANGAFADGSLIADSNGDLFGTTFSGGANGDGTVFEIVKTPTGYARTPTTLVSFNNANGRTPFASLIVDANGDLFGTMKSGGPNGDGEVFEIKKTASGYASTPIVVASFNGTNGDLPLAGLIADANGDLFGTTGGGGANDDGTVFEITDSGFVTEASTTLPPASTTPPPPSAAASHDILFQNANGQVASWAVNGASLTGAALLGGSPGPGWKAVGTGDFNDDNEPDILLQNTSGSVAIWETNGTNIIGSGLVANPGLSWKAVASGDFNGDHFSDILLQNTSGQIAVWEMNGTKIASSAVVANPGSSWKAIGTGDFNDDGHSDILLQSTNGQVAIWEMNGTHLTSSAVVANPGASWKVVGTGDFNGDHHSDILLQNTNGQVAIWEMNGTNLTDSALVANPGPSWHAIGTSGEGSSDILLQNASGQTAIWDMNGTNVASAGAISHNPGSSWKAIGLI